MDWIMERMATRSLFCTAWLSFALTIVLCSDCSILLAQEAPEVILDKAVLKHARQLIRDTPPPGHRQDSLAVIRVVNYLRLLGKDATMALLWEIAPVDGAWTGIVDSDEMSDQPQRVGYPCPFPGWDDQRVCVIVPLLFELPANGPVPPAEWYDPKKQRWRMAAAMLIVQDRIPFDVLGDCTGNWPAARPLVEWAAEHGNLRGKPLRPCDNPLSAADALFRKIRAGGVPGISKWWPRDDPKMTMIRDHIRDQAIAMLPREFKSKKPIPWKELKRKVAKNTICWDQKTQAYTASDESKKK